MRTVCAVCNNLRMETENTTRTYVVGLPVVVTITEDGFVTVTVDTDELGVSIAEDESTLLAPEQVASDEGLLDRWAATHTLQAEGYAE